MTDRLVIAAPASGSGKTTVATGLLAALRARGTVAAPFKVGPDYIDPGYHTLAAGRAGRNLDPILVGEHRIAPLLRHGAAGADLAVIEGVMGMFDGRSVDSDLGSTAHVAKLLAAPVILVVDAWGQARSIAAVLHGFRGFDPDVRLAGVIANRVGSPTHARILSRACDQVGLPLLGALPRTELVELPSRHLGLVTAAEHGPEATAAIDAMTELISGHVDLDAITRLAAAAPPLTATPWNPAAEVTPVPGSPLIAVAGGPAFTFGYAEHLDLLTAAGARIAVFDPLRDPGLPQGTAGVVLPGGFPEQHAEALSANTPLRHAIRDFARAGGPLHAECGGLLFLVRTLDGHPMCAVLDADAKMTNRLTLGYRDATAAADSILGPKGSPHTGHEFHRTTVHPSASTPPAWHWPTPDGTPHPEGFVHGNVHASYLHTHPAGNPRLIQQFVRACC
ncbi:MAG TPA: cobyrinate a,c-diamide synthase [Actinophytocola sp.]|uniref:cobyrinate a,c-diamide synthase n=1 Tax=Actinophytocola sp. TaxID=1872138 RepID=UPI002DDD7A8D|nr:cobyrinate a,c-diamide synthase [Actinophytocola sp.]HEV2782795.1 cobyrinate a,c-diamide synthase [Actinophytocola sp.]